MQQRTAPPPGQDSGEQMQDKAKEAASQAQDKVQETARQGAEQAKSRLRTQVDERSTQAGQQVSGAAGDLRTVADQLRQQGKDQPAKVAEQAADRAERLGSYLSESDADRILHDVEGYARRQPWAVVAGGVLVGFAASRFLKASSRSRYEQHPSHATTPARRPVGGPDPEFDRLVPTDQVVPGAAPAPAAPVVTDDVVVGPNPTRPS